MRNDTILRKTFLKYIVGSSYSNVSKFLTMYPTSNHFNNFKIFTTKCIVYYYCIYIFFLYISNILNCKYYYYHNIKYKYLKPNLT